MHFSTIVDAGNSPAHAHILFAAMAAAGLPPVRYLVLTHWDWAALRAGASTSAADSIVVHIPEERIAFLSDCRYEDLYVELTAEAVRLRLVGETVTRMGADRVAVLAALAQELGQPPDEDTLAFADAFLAGL